MRTIAWFVLLTSASSVIIEFLFKSNARASFGTGPDLLRFFALFYGSVQVLSFIAQTQSGRVLQRARGQWNAERRCRPASAPRARSP